MNRIIGIDLGTTNSCVSVLENGVPKVITNAEGSRVTPSVVALKNGERLIGESARRQIVTNRNTVASIKSKMGTSHKVDLEGVQYTPQEISAMIIHYLKLQAETYLGEEVSHAVITVPAYFNDAQRQATKDAGKIAGLKIERIINEPTAAALAYGMDKLTGTQTIMVYDFGGGTFDVSILELDHGMFEVKSTAGDNDLGGDNFDDILCTYLLEQFKEQYEVDLSEDHVAVSRIREAAERAKRELSSSVSTQVDLPFIGVLDGKVLHLEVTITRSKFEQLTQDLVTRSINSMNRAMRDSGLIAEELDKVILVGGTTRIPAVVDAVKKVTKQEPYKGVNPDEVVAMGAAIQGGVLTGEVQDLVLIDVTPLSLGIQIAGGLFSVIIPRNSSIPTSMTKTFSTAVDGQDTVKVHVLQGERALAKDNKSLGNFLLTDILPAPSGVPQIEVTFTLDKNGIVSVSAKDTSTGRAQTVVMQSESGLDDEDIGRMIRAAEVFAKRDEELANKINLINNAQQLLLRVRQFILTNEVLLELKDLEEATELCRVLEWSVEVDDLINLPDNIIQLKDKYTELLVKTYQNDQAGNSEN